MKIIYQYTIYVDKGRLPKRGKYGKISGLEQGTQMSYQRSWKNSRLEKRKSGKTPAWEQKH
jgi:hypothetical protein